MQNSESCDEKITTGYSGSNWHERCVKGWVPGQWKISLQLFKIHNTLSLLGEGSIEG